MFAYLTAALAALPQVPVPESARTWRPPTTDPLDDYAARLQDRIADARKTTGFCADCDTTWVGGGPCWSCGPHLRLP